MSSTFFPTILLLSNSSMWLLIHAAKMHLPCHSDQAEACNQASRRSCCNQHVTVTSMPVTWRRRHHFFCTVCSQEMNILNNLLARVHLLPSLYLTVQRTGHRGGPVVHAAHSVRQLCASRQKQQLLGRSGTPHFSCVLTAAAMSTTSDAQHTNRLAKEESP